jgi:uridine kinase
MIIGICGGTGSGKSTISRKLLEAIGEENLLLLAQDAYYKDNSHLPLGKRAEINFDHPDAIDSALLIEHVDLLSKGQPILQPIYDFALHVRQKETRLLLPRPIVVVEGILIFENQELRERFDLKVFVETDPDERLIRRLHRDLTKRGRTVDSVIQQYLLTVRPMHLQFVEPSRRHADVIIPGGEHNSGAVDFLIKAIKFTLQT